MIDFSQEQQFLKDVVTLAEYRRRMKPFVDALKNTVDPNYKSPDTQVEHGIEDLNRGVRAIMTSLAVVAPDLVVSTALKMYDMIGVNTELFENISTEKWRLIFIFMLIKDHAPKDEKIGMSPLEAWGTSKLY